jgi:hypothetical protein
MTSYNGRNVQVIRFPLSILSPPTATHVQGVSKRAHQRYCSSVARVTKTFAFKRVQTIRRLRVIKRVLNIVSLIDRLCSVNCFGAIHIQRFPSPPSSATEIITGL